MRKHDCPFAVAAAVLAVALAPALADSGAAHKTKQPAPVKLGTSGGSLNDRSNLYCCGGTLGSLVSYDGQLSILSNNHILARSGSAASGEDTIQPGLIDVGCNGATSNIVGDFAGDKVPLGTANVDAAISTARSGMVDATGSILDIGVPCSNVQTPTVGLAVAKSGRTSGYTTGSVQSVNTSVSVQYQKGCNSGRKFTVSYTNQVVISGSGSFSAGGDSGSLIVSNDGTPNPVALLFAGNSTQTIGNPIASVVSAFQAGGHTFTFVGSSCAAPAASGDPAPGSRPALAADPSLIGATDLLPAAELDFARGVKDRYEADLFARTGVIGVGVGADETEKGRAAIVVYVSSIESSHPQPRLFPPQIEGVKVRVIPTEPFVAQ